MPTEEEQQTDDFIHGVGDRIGKTLETVPADGSTPPPQAPPPTEPEEEETTTPPSEQNAATEPTGAANEPVEPAAPASQEPPEPKEGEETPPVAAQEPAADDRDEIDAEIDAIEADPKATKRTTGVLKIIKDRAKDLNRQRKEALTKIKELEGRSILDDPTKTELEQLRTLRDQVAIEQSPVFQGFQQTVREHETQAVGLLQQWRLPEETAKFISDQGGLLKFQQSNEPMPQGARDLEGQPFRGTQSEWWETIIEPTLNKAQKQQLEDHLFEARRAIRERNSAVQKARGNPKEFFEKQNKERDAFIKDYTERADKHSDKILPLYGEIAKPKVVPENATAAQKKEIEQHNATLAQAKQTVLRYMNDNSPEGRMEQAVAGAYREFAQNHIKEVETDRDSWKTKFTDLEKKWNAAKSSAQTSRQQGVVQQVQEKPKPEKYDPERSISKLMDTVPA